MKQPIQRRRVSGAETMGMIVTLEAFVIALAGSEAKTRPDALAFVNSLRESAHDSADQFGHDETSEFTRAYTQQLVTAILKEAGIEEAKSS